MVYNSMRMWQGSSSDISSPFYYKMFKSKKYLYLLTSYSQGLTSDRLRLYYKDFAQINLPHLSIEEQQEIAFFLSNTDTKIEKPIHKKELLEQYKKGVMQKIFSREIRFKDDNGEDFPDLEEKKLGDIAAVNPKIKKLPKTLIYIDLESVKSGIFIQEKELKLVNPPSRAQRLLERGDILFQTLRPYQKNNYHFLIDINSDYVASTGYAQIRAKESASYLFYALHLEPFVLKVMNLCTGTSYPAINSSDLSKIKMKFPVPTEQQKIADFLTDIDSKINRMDKENFDVKEFKNGLLKGLFV